MTYIALIMQDHRYNNPVAVSFYQILIMALHDNRHVNARLKLVSNLKLITMVSRIHEDDLEVGESSHAVSWCAQHCGKDKQGQSRGCSVVDTVEKISKQIKELPGSKGSSEEQRRTNHIYEQKKRAYARRKVARARWYLAYMLLRNPRLRRFRVHDLPEDGKGGAGKQTGA